MKKLVLGLVIGMLLGSMGAALAADSPAVQAMFEKFSLKINDKEPVEIQPLTYNGTTYLPVREAAKLLGYEVDYDKATRLIELTNNDQVEPDKATPKTEKPKEVNNVTQTNIGARDLINLLAEKYPDVKDRREIYFDQDNNILGFNGVEYVLTKTEDGKFNTQPLIDKGILNESDFLKVPSAS